MTVGFINITGIDEAAQPSLVSYQRAFSTAVPCGRRCRALERGALHTLRRTPADRRRQVLLCRTRTRQVRQRRGRSGVVVAAASSHRVKTADVPGRVHGCLEHLLHHRRSVVQVKKVRARHPTISLRLWYVGEQTASTSRRASGRHASRTCTAACAASTRLCLTPPAHGQLNAVSLVLRLPCPRTATSAALKPACVCFFDIGPNTYL